MDLHTAKTFIGKNIKIIACSLHFTGTIIDVGETSLILNDKYGQKVSLSLKDISICSEVQNGCLD